MLVQVKVKALKDEARVFGLVMPKGAQVDIDLDDSQLPKVQAAVDAGDIEVAGMPKTEPKAVKK